MPSNDQDYTLALSEIEQIFTALPGAPQGDWLEGLVTSVEAYEARYFALPANLLNASSGN
jgi:hypothetical protein